MRIGPRYNYICKNILLNETEVLWVNKADYLGVRLCNAKRFKCYWSDAKRKFYCCSNTIFGKLGTMNNVSTLLKLINSTSLQKLIYGNAATSLNKAELKELSNVYNSIFVKLFKTFDINIITACQY